MGYDLIIWSLDDTGGQVPGGEGYNSGPGEVTPPWTPRSPPWDDFDEVRACKDLRCRKTQQECNRSTYENMFFLL